jgi:hypothetical protein
MCCKVKMNMRTDADVQNNDPGIIDIIVNIH